MYPGVVLEAPDDDALVKCAEELAAEGAEALAVCFLWSSANAANEQRAKEVLAHRFPGLAISISSDVAPVVREYERMVTTAVNASLLPLLGDYLRTVEDELAALGFRGELQLMQSHGGVARPSAVAIRPILTMRSGPVGGAVAAAQLARRLERKAIVACDIGGTSCDTTVILDYEIPITDRLEVNYQPIVVPTADIRCIGAGGGSIARIDTGAVLRVGPESAGADPGPACYLRGGRYPTLTDANLILGRLDEDALVHEGLSLSLEVACQSVGQLARVLGRTIDSTAEAIVRVAVSNMANSVRLQTIDRGLDPRDMTLVAFGGAGPLHATLIADACLIGEVAIPPDPGVFSALGMVLADRTVSLQSGLLAPLASVEPDELGRRFEVIEDQARALLAVSSAGSEVRVVRSAAMRYELQEWELRVRLPDDLRFGPEVATVLADAFHAAHRARYGFAREDKAVELVTLYIEASLPSALRIEAADSLVSTRRATARTIPGSQVPAPQVSTLRLRATNAVIGRRDVWMDELTGRVTVPVYERARLFPGAMLPGPCLIEESTSTTYLHGGWTGIVADLGTIVASRSADE